MSNGLASQSVAGYDIQVIATPVLVYTPPLNKGANITLSICNRNRAAVKIRVARGTGASPAATDWVEYDTLVGYGSPLIRSGLSLSYGDKVWVQSDTINVTVSVDGVEG